MFKRQFFAVALCVALLTAAIGAAPVYWWVTLYDGGKPVQVWVTTEEPKVSGETCRFIPQGQKNETIIHGVFSISTQPPPELPDRAPNPKGF